MVLLSGIKFSGFGDCFLSFLVFVLFLGFEVVSVVVLGRGV